jgi:hypothetical protein
MVAIIFGAFLSFLNRKNSMNKIPVALFSLSFAYHKRFEIDKTRFMRTVGRKRQKFLAKTTTQTTSGHFVSLSSHAQMLKQQDTRPLKKLPLKQALRAAQKTVADEVGPFTASLDKPCKK